MPRSKDRNRECQFCGTPFLLGTPDTTHKYCSISCRKKFHASIWSSKYGGRNKASTRAWRLRTKYGLAPEDFQVMLEQQDNSCAICRTREKPYYNWHVDHCHKTGKIRGLLCSKCNHALGLVKDKIEVLERMKEYLIEHSG